MKEGALWMNYALEERQCGKTAGSKNNMNQKLF